MVSLKWMQKKKKRHFQDGEVITVEEAYRHQYLLAQFDNVQFYCYEHRICEIKFHEKDEGGHGDIYTLITGDGEPHLMWHDDQCITVSTNPVNRPSSNPKYSPRPIHGLYGKTWG